MARVKRGVAAHKRHKRLLKAAEGNTGTHRRLIRSLRSAVTVSSCSTTASSTYRSSFSPNACPRCCRNWASAETKSSIVSKRQANRSRSSQVLALVDVLP